MLKMGSGMSIQMGPEIEAGFRTEAEARGVSVDRVLREALDLYRSQHAARRVPLNGRRRELAWICTPDAHYMGEWVALEGDEVVAHGQDGKAVYESARAKGITSPFMFFVSEPDPRQIVGGWIDNE